MVDVQTKVEFAPVEMKTGSGWSVRVLLPSGKEFNLGGFKTITDAKEWIARKSALWLKLKECERSRNA
jgi:hypothetical protein